MFLAPRNLEASACPIRKTFGESHLNEPSDGPSKLLRAVANLETSAAAIRGSLFAMCPNLKSQCRELQEILSKSLVPLEPGLSGVQEGCNDRARDLCLP